MSNNKSNMYVVIWVAGDRDGEIMGATLTEGEAITMAKKLYDTYQDDFDPKYGGIGIIAPDGSDVEW